jgi:hypothetical protein
MIYIYLNHMKKHFMSTNDNSSITDTVNLFYSESNKLEDILSQSLKNSEKLSLSEIIGLYYQIINVTSLVKFLRQNLKGTENMKEENPLLDKIQEIEKYIDEKFDSNLHLLLMSNLKKSIETLKKKLKDFTTNQPKKTKEMVENQAKMYEELRQIMSTKEFVDQYNNGLNNKLEN